MNDMQDAEFAEIGELEIVEQKVEPKSVLEDILPDEFKGKTISEIAKSALFYRSQMGKQANELGEVRKLADELIKSQLHREQEHVVSEEIDIFENPKEAIRRAIEANPTVQSVAAQAENARKALALQQMTGLHPDYSQLAQDSGFTEWVGKSNIRKQLFQNANAYDVEAADELFSTYKALRSARQTAVSDTEKSARNTAMNAASVPSGGSGESSKKMYRRTDIMKLMTTDRKRYESMQEEIMAAYAEGRVR